MKLKSSIFRGSEGPHLLITGGVHGDEFEPMAAIRRLIARFASEASELKGTLELIPCVNEAAFLRGHRVAEEDGRDLARTCPGDPDGTVTERAAHAVSERIRQADAYIDLHTGGTELAVLPLTGYHLVTDPGILDRQRAMARAFNLPFIWGTSAKCDGRTLSVAREAGVPAIYAEHGGSATMTRRGVEDYVEGCLNVMGCLGMIEREPPTSRIDHLVEDSRPDSGHMQICNPSPMTGFFDAAVFVGDRVNRGDLLGTVSDHPGEEIREVRAENGGIVLVLRTFPRVRKGETLGVVVEVE